MQKAAKGWLKCWLYVITWIAGVILGITFIKWQSMDWQTRLFAMATALLPLHVLEEWRFPGGFHTMYNLMADSEKLDRYPMNQLSDMWTNWIGVIFGCVVLIAGVRPIFMIMQLFLCLAELFGHTNGGIFSYKRFKAQGKKTIYNPGLATTVFGYLPIAVGIFITFFTVKAPAIWEILVGLLCSALLGAFSLRGMEKLCLNENSPYAYDWGDGYFEKFLK